MPDTIDQNQQTTPADTYRWPQKVKRYGLDTHPFLRLFVALFENTVPWNKHPKGWNANLLNEYIRETLLPALEPTDCVGESNAPFSGKYYLNIALEAALQADEHAELVALRSRVSSDPEGVKSEVLHFFNKRKQVRFTTWWDFMNREYSDEPAWIYCVLKSVFDECGLGVRRTPDRVEPDALRNLAAAVQLGKFVPGVGIANRYVIERMSHLTGTDRYLHNGWTRIPGFSTLGPSLDGVRLLAFLGRKAGWCVASEGTGRNYLTTCDFFVMCDQDKPVVGARIGKDAIYEAAGYRNGAPPFTRDIELLRRVVFPYQTWAINYWSGSDTQHCSDGQWRDVLRRFPFGWDEAPEHIRNDVALKNEVLAALIRQSAMDPFWVPYVPTEFMGRPEFAQVGKISWREHLMSRPVPLSKIPVQFLNDPDIVDAWQFGWEYYADSYALEADKIPEQILQSDTFTAHWAKGWERTFNGSIPGNITTWWQRTPHELRELPTLKELWINGWETELRRLPRVWIDVPNELRELPRVREAWITGWQLVLQSSSKSYKDVPSELREQSTVREAWINACEVELRRYPKSYEDVPNELKKLPCVRQAWIDGWEAELRNAPERYKDVPNELKELPCVRDAWIQGWEAELRRFPESCQQVPHELRGLPNVRETWINGWVVQLRRFPRDWIDVPHNLRELPSVRDAWIQGWEAELRRFPKIWPHIPNELRELPSVRVAWINTWEAELRRSARCWMNIPDELRALPKFRQIWINGWEAQVRDHPKTWVSIPAELKQLQLFKQLWISGWEAELRRSPESFQHIPSELLELPSIQEALNDARIQSSEDAPESVQHETRSMDAWRHTLPSQMRDPWTLRIFEQMTSTDQVDQLLERWATLKSFGSRSPKSVIMGMSDEELPPAFAANAVIRKARERHWRGVMKENPRAFPRVPESLRSDANLLGNFRAALGPEIRSNPLIWETLHEVIRADECLQRVHRIATRGNLDLAA